MTLVFLILLTRVPGQFYSRADRSGSFSNDVLAYMTYSSGPLMAGILGVYGSYHIGPEALLQTAKSPTRLLVPVDSDLFHGTIYEKYNNGRFFLNSELAWLYWTDRFGADLSNRQQWPPSCARATNVCPFPDIGRPTDPIHRTIEGRYRNGSRVWARQNQFPECLVSGPGQAEWHVHRQAAGRVCQTSVL